MKGSGVKKLTLSAEEETIRQARRLARRNNTSISAMFSRMVRSMSEGEQGRPRMSPIARRMSGILKLPKGKTAEQLLDEALREKYGLDK